MLRLKTSDEGSFDGDGRLRRLGKLQLERAGVKGMGNAVLPFFCSCGFVITFCGSYKDSNFFERILGEVWGASAMMGVTVRCV